MDNDNIKRTGPSIKDFFKNYGVSKLAPMDFCRPARFKDGSAGCKYGWKIEVIGSVGVVYSSLHESGAHFVVSINKETGLVRIIKTLQEKLQVDIGIDPYEYVVIYSDVPEDMRDIEIVLDNNIDQDKFYKSEDVKMQKIMNMVSKEREEYTKKGIPVMDIFCNKNGVILFLEEVKQRSLTDQEKDTIEEGTYKFINHFPVKI